MRKKILEKRQQRLTQKKSELTQRAMASNDAAEVRAINEQINEINEDLEDIREELDAIAQEERAANPPMQGDPIPATAQQVNGNVRGTFEQGAQEEDPLASMAYRKAFRAYVTAGTPIPAELRAGDATKIGRAHV